MFARRPILLALACAALLCTGHAVAAVSSGPDYEYAAPQIDFDGVLLQPGEFAWLPGSEVRSNAPVTMLVNLRDQRAYLYRDGRRIAVTTVSTGMPGHDTPTGVFPIMGKEQMHHSNRYNNAPMPWMQRLTEWGHALHAGNVRPSPASHGCVRLPAEFAKQLYSMTQRGDIVVISHDASLVALARAGVDSQLALQVGVPASAAMQGFADRAPVEAADRPAAPAVAAEVGAASTTSF